MARTKHLYTSLKIQSFFLAVLISALTVLTIPMNQAVAKDQSEKATLTVEVK